MNIQIFLLVFACLQTILLIYQSTIPAFRTPASLVASTFSVADAIGLCILSHVEHVRSVRPSAIINVYLLITLPFDVARSKSLWTEGATKSLAAVFSGAIGIKFMILVTEAIEKRSILLSRYQHYSPEATSGIYSRSFFFWLNKLMTTGFNRVLSNEDLYPIDEEMTSKILHGHAHIAWNNTNKTDARALLWSTLRANYAAFTYCILPRICLIGFRYAQPLLLTRTVEFANNPHDPESVGWGLTAAFGLVFLGLAIANGAYYHMCYRFVVASRGSLVTLIYAKTMDLSITALDESAAVTLMSNDTSKIISQYYTTVANNIISSNNLRCTERSPRALGSPN
jgi:ATP-binding cassette subfamily C (CFTR/MRP) protein 1